MSRGRELKLGALALLTLVWLGGTTARADEPTAPRREMPGPGLEPVPQLETSYTFGGKTKFEGNRAGNSDAFNTRLELAEPIPLSDRWVMTLRLNSQNIFLGSVSGTPVPSEIHTLGLTTGLGYRLGDDWQIMGFLGPTLYRFSDVRIDDIGLSGGITAMWQYRPDLRFMFGLAADPDSDLPVLPIAGVDWKISDSWDLNLMLPHPRVVYQLNNESNLFFGANMVAATFRANAHAGSDIGQSQYNNALGTYRDLRIGGGASLKLSDHARLELEAGYSVSRHIDYTRVDQTARFDPAPYVQLGLKISF